MRIELTVKEEKKRSISLLLGSIWLPDLLLELICKWMPLAYRPFKSSEKLKLMLIILPNLCSESKALMSLNGHNYANSFLTEIKYIFLTSHFILKPPPTNIKHIIIFFLISNSAQGGLVHDHEFDAYKVYIKKRIKWSVGESPSLSMLLFFFF